MPLNEALSLISAMCATSLKVMAFEIAEECDIEENMVLERIFTPMYKAVKNMMSDEDFRWREKRGN